VIAGLAFCIIFGLLTIGTMVLEGPDGLTLVSLAVLGLLGAALYGAIQNPPEE
jgi:hypothetical protein